MRDYVNGFIELKSFSFLDVDTDSQVDPLQLQHGAYIWFTRKIARYIDIEWTVYWWSCDQRMVLLKKLHQVFEPVMIESWDKKWFFPIEFEECNWFKWTWNAKVHQWLQYNNYDNCCWIDFRVRLVVWSNVGISDMCMVWSTEYSALNKRNVIPGMDFDLDWSDIDGDTFGFPLDYQTNFWAVINYTGVSFSNVKVVITALQDWWTPTNRIMIKCRETDWTRRTLWIEWITMSQWDVLIVDWNNVTLNWFDVSWLLNLPYDQTPGVYNTAFDSVLLWNNIIRVDSDDPHQYLQVDYFRRDKRC